MQNQLQFQAKLPVGLLRPACRAARLHNFELCPTPTALQTQSRVEDPLRTYSSFHALENSCSVVYLWPTQAATHSLTPHILTSVYRKGTGLTEEVVVMNLTLSSDRHDACCSSLKSSHDTKGALMHVASWPSTCYSRLPK